MFGKCSGAGVRPAFEASRPCIFVAGETAVRRRPEARATVFETRSHSAGSLSRPGRERIRRRARPGLALLARAEPERHLERKEPAGPDGRSAGVVDGRSARPIHARHSQRAALHHGLRRRRAGIAGSDHLFRCGNRQTTLAARLQRFSQRHNLSSLCHLESGDRPGDRQCLCAGHAGNPRRLHGRGKAALEPVDDGGLRAPDFSQRPHRLAPDRPRPGHHPRHHRQLGRARSGRRPVLRVRQEDGRTGLGIGSRRPADGQFLLAAGAGLAGRTARVLCLDWRRQRRLRERPHGRSDLAHPAFQSRHQFLRARPQQ